MNGWSRVPVATYRLQLHEAFSFDDARAQIDYLAELGISDLYLSPIMQARAGSTHGYDVTDPTVISPVLGGDQGFSRLAATAAERGLGIIVDIVPNHMAASTENPSWDATLREGLAAEQAVFFDIFWDHDEKLVLPILGDHYANVLERDEILVDTSEDVPRVVYFDHRLPINTSTNSLEALVELDQAESAETRRALIDRLLSAQHYRLSYWRTGSQVVNYRRFFDINDLAAVRGDGAAFEAVHKRVLELVESGQVSGLRIDHIDGLRDPAAYLQRLRDAVRQDGRFYVIVEKILSGDEQLPADWETAGTTGYDGLNMINGVLTSGRGLEALVELTRRYAAGVADFDALLYRAKHQVIDELFTADVDRLTRRLTDIARRDRFGRDLIPRELNRAIREVTVALPVYRTYIARARISDADRTRIEQSIAQALSRRPDLQVALAFLRRVLLIDDGNHFSQDDVDARSDFIAAWQQLSGPVMAKGLEDTTLYRDPTLLSSNAVGGERDVAEISVADFHSWAAERAEHWPLAMTATSTHDSKRSEDVRARIAVLSEAPGEWNEVFERLLEASAVEVRSIDGQPVPDGRTALTIFQTLFGSWPLDDGEMEDYLGRIQAYAVKAEREAKLQTSWIEQNTLYEEALQAFIANLLQNERFLAELRPFRERIAFHGMLNSLSATLLKTTMPGVPDTYQGTELWDFSLVDPDNRRPIDYDQRRRRLSELEAVSDPSQLLENWQSGAVKMFVLNRALRFRTANRGLFEQGRYIPLAVEGINSNHVLAFARVHHDKWAVVMVPRLTLVLAQSAGQGEERMPLGETFWDDTRILLPEDGPASWSDAFTGGNVASVSGSLPVSATLGNFPLALLIAGQS